MKEPEKIHGRRIHEAASVFPLMEGAAFQRLVDSIAVRGVQNPIVCSGHVVLDGRNRLRAVEKLLNEGVEVTLPAVEWVSTNGMTEVEWIEAQNLDRRHLSPESFAAARAALDRLLRAEAKERQKAGLKKGNEKPVGIKRSPRGKRDEKAKQAASTAGQVAAKAGVSLRKAKQAVKLDQAVVDGKISEEVQRDVIAGKTKLRDAVKKIPAEPKKAGSKGGAKKRRAADVLDDLRLLLSELLASERVTKQQIIDELTTWIDRANNR